MIDIASRVYNHNWKIDPIVRSLLDIDFYKLLMAQFVLRNSPNVTVEFSVINRSNKIPLTKLIDEQELREQLENIKKLSLSRGESTWLRGNSFYGKHAIFKPEFIKMLSPHLELKLKPAILITGTFIHKASHVVVTPVYGKVSKQRSISL